MPLSRAVWEEASPAQPILAGTQSPPRWPHPGFRKCDWPKTELGWEGTPTDYCTDQIFGDYIVVSPLVSVLKKQLDCQWPDIFPETPVQFLFAFTGIFPQLDCNPKLFVFPLFPSKVLYAVYLAIAGPHGQTYHQLINKYRHDLNRSNDLYKLLAEYCC